MPFLQFMSSPAGRVSRVVAGSALIVVGAVLGGGWLALVVVGALPLATGVLDVCLFAPLARRPFKGREFRQATRP